MPACRFIPDEVLERLARDPGLSAPLCEAAARCVRVSQSCRGMRARERVACLRACLGAQPPAEQPQIQIFDCQNTQNLPGLQILQPGHSDDATVRRAFAATSLMAAFLREAFQRNSIDDRGMALVSSVHYGQQHNNALWNGRQMVYGDGDNQLFVDLTWGLDVIGHELAHGINQYSLQLGDGAESAGLNESLADCFGAMFRQWRLRQDAEQADWQLGQEILGPTLRGRGLTCLRDMSDPGGKHCLQPQPRHHGQLQPGDDRHHQSGPPNLAFCTACKRLGGHSWQTVGKVWYHVMTSGSAPRMDMAEFARKTRQAAGLLFGAGACAEAAVDAGWTKVGL